MAECKVDIEAVDYRHGTGTIWRIVTPPGIGAGCTCKFFIDGKLVTAAGDYGTNGDIHVSGTSQTHILVEPIPKSGELRVEVVCPNCESLFTRSLGKRKGKPIGTFTGLAVGGLAGWALGLFLGGLAGGLIGAAIGATIGAGIGALIDWFL